METTNETERKPEDQEKQTAVEATETTQAAVEPTKPVARVSLTAGTQTVDDVIEKLDPARKERLGRRLQSDAKGTLLQALKQKPSRPAVGSEKEIKSIPAVALAIKAKAKLTQLAGTLSQYARDKDMQKKAAAVVSVLVVIAAVAIMYATGVAFPTSTKNTQAEKAHPTPEHTHAHGGCSSGSPCDHDHHDHTHEQHKHEQHGGCGGCGHDHGDERTHTDNPSGNPHAKPTEEEMQKQLMQMFGVDTLEELEKILKPKQQNEESAPVDDLSDVEFIASETFTGEKEGYYFRDDVQGTGYYKEKEATPAKEEQTPAEEEPELVMEGDLSKFRIKQLKKIITKAGMDHSTLFEKRDFVEMACEARQKLTEASS